MSDSYSGKLMGLTASQYDPDILAVPEPSEEEKRAAEAFFDKESTREEDEAKAIIPPSRPEINAALNRLVNMSAEQRSKIPEHDVRIYLEMIISAQEDWNKYKSPLAKAIASMPSLPLPAKWHKQIICGLVNVAPGETYSQRVSTVNALIMSLNDQVKATSPEMVDMIMGADGFALLLLPKRLLDQIDAATEDHSRTRP